MKEANQEIGDNQIGHTGGSPDLNQRDYSQTLPRLTDLVQDLSKIDNLLKRYEPKEGITAREQLLDRMQKEFWQKIDSFQARLDLGPSDGYHLNLNVELSHPKQENGELTDIEQFFIKANDKINSIKKDNNNILKITNNDAEIFANIMKEVNAWKKDNVQKLSYIYATIDTIPCFKDIHSRIQPKFKEADSDIEKCFGSAIKILENNLSKKDFTNFRVELNKILQEFKENMSSREMLERPIYDDIIKDQAYEEKWNKKIEEGRKKTPFNEMIKVRIEKLKPNYETLYSLITLRDDKVSELHDQRKKKTKECANIALSLLAGQIEKLDSEIQESDRQVSTIKKELGETTQLLQSTNENIRGCKKRLDELSKEQEELKIERQRVDDKYKKLPPEAQKLFDANFKLKEKITKLQKEKSSIKEETKKFEQLQHQTEGESSYVDKMVQGALDAMRQMQRQG